MALQKLKLTTMVKTQTEELVLAKTGNEEVIARSYLGNNVLSMLGIREIAFL